MVRETEARTRRAMGTRHFAMNAGLGARSGERKRKESLAAEAQRTQRWEGRRGRYKARLAFASANNSAFALRKRRQDGRSPKMKQMADSVHPASKVASICGRFRKITG